jgi:hypothetical protein
MAKGSPHQETASKGWSTDSQIVREFDRPVRVSDAVIETLTKAIEDWSELSKFPPVAEFVDADNLDGLFKTRAVDDTSHIPSVEFLFQDALVTVMYGATVRVIIEQDT